LTPTFPAWSMRARRLLLAAVLAVIVLAILALSLRIAVLAEDTRALRRQEAELAARLARPAAPAPSLVSLLPSLPPFAALAKVTADTQRLFRDAGLSLRDAAHTPLDADGRAGADDIGQVEITLHLKGDYPATRKSIGALLVSHEELALKSLSMNRDQAIDTAPQVETRFTLYYRRRP